jgi:preprotein translocase subunit SecE
MDDRPSGPRRLPSQGRSDVARVNPGEFLRQVRTETGKVVWPTRRETLMTGLMVVIMTTILGLFFFGVDSAFSAIVQLLLGLVA